MIQRGDGWISFGRFEIFWNATTTSKAERADCGCFIANIGRFGINIRSKKCHGDIEEQNTNISVNKRTYEGILHELVIEKARNRFLELQVQRLNEDIEALTHEGRQGELEQANVGLAHQIEKLKARNARGKAALVTLVNEVLVWAARPTKDGAKKLRDLASAIAEKL